MKIQRKLNLVWVWVWLWVYKAEEGYANLKFSD